MAQKLPDEIRRQVIPAFRELKTAAAVSDRLHIGRTTVCRILEKAGIKRGGPGQVHPHKLSAEQERDVVRRYAAGERSGALAREVGCSVFLIRKLARKAGCIIYGRGNRNRDFSADEIADMGRMWQAGESQNSIATRMGVRQTVISNALARAGIKKQTRHARGKRHGHWKGGRALADGGYVLASVSPDDPLAEMRGRTGYIPEHRLVMARHLGRVLLPTETVHHINGKRDDNRIENLELWASRHPRGERVGEKHCPTCTCNGGSP